MCVQMRMREKTFKLSLIRIVRIIRHITEKSLLNNTMKLTIIGGGISGLSAAYYALKRFPNASITVLEARNRTGGWICSKRHPAGYVFEQGPRTIRPSGVAGENTLQIIEEIGISSKIIPISRQHPAARNRMICVNNNLYALPNNFFNLFTKQPPFSKSLFAFFLNDLVAPQKILDDESMHDFIERRLGTEVANYLAGALIRGVCAGDSKKISVKFLGKRLSEYERIYGSIVRGALRDLFSRKRIAKEVKGSLTNRAYIEKWSIYTFDGGIETLVEAIHDYIVANGVSIRTNVKCIGIQFQDNGERLLHSDGSSELVDRIIVALPANSAAQLFQHRQSVLASELSTIPSATVAVVNLHYKGDVIKQKAFGFLVPPTENSPILGITFDSCCVPNIQGDTILTVMIGGPQFKNFFGIEPKPNLLQRAAEEAVIKILGVNVPISNAHVEVLHNCIPQYIVGHEAKINRIEKLQSDMKKIVLCGASYYGVGVNDCITTAKKAVEQLT